MSAEMAKKPKVERRITSGNLWSIAVMVAGIVGGTGYNHFTPSVAADHAAKASDEAIAKASDAAAKAAVIETRVTEHTQEIGQIMLSMGDVRMDVAVLKAQGLDAKSAAQQQADKLDKILAAVYRMQGRVPPPSNVETNR